MTTASQSDSLRVEAPRCLGCVIIPAALLDVLTDTLRYARVSTVRPLARVNQAPLVCDVITHVTCHYWSYYNYNTTSPTSLLGGYSVQVNIRYTSIQFIDFILFLVFTRDFVAKFSDAIVIVVVVVVVTATAIS